MNIKVYLLDEQCVFLRSEYVGDESPMPPRSVLTAPPVVSGLKVAQWQVDHWVTLNEAPDSVSSPAPDWAALIGARRFISEACGCLVNSMPIATDRDSQSLITGAAVAALLDSDYSLNWKTSAGFIALSAVQILSLASAVRAHVQASFDREAQLLAAVADGSITAAMLEQGWPT